MKQEQAPVTVEVVDVQFRPGQKVYYFAPHGIRCRPGDRVVIDTARGTDFGVCTSANHRIPRKDLKAPLRPVLRLANSQDIQANEERIAKEQEALGVCTEQIAEHRLDMRLIGAELTFDGSKLIFYFTADERVDFRELVKSLAAIYHTRIELRQIGVRDKAKLVGGLGICGRPFCCATFLEDFQTVSIKMAKTQNLSLNPTKISGTCGRLLCCLNYEQEAYEHLLRTSPKEESFVDTPDGRGTVVGLDLLHQRVRVRMEREESVVGTYPIADIAVLRNGKAKKTDPPIPADLAPISGNGKRRKKVEDEEAGQLLDSIRLRYSSDVIAEATTEEPTPEQPKSNRRKRKKRKSGAQQNPEAQASAQSQPAPKQGEQKQGQNKQNQPNQSQKPKQPQGQQKQNQPKQSQGQQAPKQGQEASKQGQQPRPENGETAEHHHRKRRRRKPKPHPQPETE